MNRCLLLLCALLACTPANAEPRPKPPKPSGLTITAAGDTARGFFSWPQVRGAAGYLYTVTVAASNGTWTGVPANVSTTARTASFAAISSTADSATFNACVRAFNAADTTAPGCTGPRTWRRKLTTPLPVWDSLTAFLLMPDTAQLWLGTYAAGTVAPVVVSGRTLYPVTVGSSTLGEARQFCPIARFVGDTIALPAAYAARPPCPSEFARALARGLIAGRAAHQAAADSACVQLSASGGAFRGPGVWQAPALGGFSLLADRAPCGGSAPGTTFLVMRTAEGWPVQVAAQ